VAKNKRRKRKSKRKPAQSRPGQTRVQPPKLRMKPIFKVFDDISIDCNDVMMRTPDPASPAVRFDAAMLMRGINTLRSIRILLEGAHWELASAGARQLFELLVNMEHLGSRPDREEGSKRYAKFGLMQSARRQQEQLEYAERTGREIDQVRKQTIDELLERAFADLKDKKGNWVSSWSGKNIRQLAEESERPIRIEQYRLLFSGWSEQTHASPGALISGIFGPVGEDAMNQIVADDYREVIEVAGVSITLFFELWWTLPKVAVLDKEIAAGWLERFAQEARKHGAPIPIPKPE
jgi:hypothetical protein